ncbi:E3 ubiquitin-protein ligase APD2 [Miscanthus floridulus]|uniref:E3 ubiquitin-protein ligase APD2 n=1 Tax=Miscanthus floridulus TaxID=154761 RepID=UPI0034597309
MNVLLIAMVSFASQWFTCLVVAAVLLAVLYCFLKQLLAENADAAEQEPIRRQDETGLETEPVLPRKEVFFNYGATEEQPESSAFPALAEDPLSEKMCKICYDAPRSCFLIPCGHCFTCFTCARRIVEEENKACPICRRLIQSKKTREHLDRYGWAVYLFHVASWASRMCWA